MTYLFIQKNGSATLTIQAENEGGAQLQLEDIVLYPYDWQSEGEEDF